MVKEARRTHGTINLPTQLLCATSDPEPCCDSHKELLRIYTQAFASVLPPHCGAAKFLSLMSGIADLLEEEAIH